MRAISLISTTILKVLRCKCSSTSRCEEFTLDYFHHLSRTVTRHKRVFKTECDNLIRAYRRVSFISIDDIVETARGFIPKELVETLACFVGHRAIHFVIWIVVFFSKVFHHTKGVVPERLNLDRFPVSRCDHQIANLSIHPCELYAWLARLKQSIVVDVNVVSSTPNVPINYDFQHRK